MRNLVRELRQVHARELHPDSRNFRTHPDGQKGALTKMIERIGYVNPILARETPEGLIIIDGHLRHDILPDETIPVVVVDVTEAQAAELMMTLDPIAALASADSDALLALIEGAPEVDEIMLGELSQLADDTEVTQGEVEELPAELDPEPLVTRFAVVIPAGDRDQVDKVKASLEAVVAGYAGATVEVVR